MGPRGGKILSAEWFINFNFIARSSRDTNASQRVREGRGSSFGEREYHNAVTGQRTGQRMARWVPRGMYTAINLSRRRGKMKALSSFLFLFFEGSVGQRGLAAKHFPKSGREIMDLFVAREEVDIDDEELVFVGSSG